MDINLLRSQLREIRKTVNQNKNKKQLMDELEKINTLLDSQKSVEEIATDVQELQTQVDSLQKPQKSASASQKKKGNEENTTLATSQESTDHLAQVFKQQLSINNSTTSTIEDINSQFRQYCLDVLNATEETLITALVHLRKVLSCENAPSTDAIPDGIYNKLIAVIDIPNPPIQFEATWCLCNLSAINTSCTTEILSRGAIPILIKNLNSPSVDVLEQTIWTFGNIAGESTPCRDYLLNQGVFPLLLSVLASGIKDSNCKLSILRNAVWAISNMCRGKPLVDIRKVKSALPVLASYCYITDIQILTDTLWALSYLSDGPDQNIQYVLDTGVIIKLVEMLVHPNFAIITPAIRTIGNLCTGNDYQTQAVLNAGALPGILRLLTSAKKGIRKEACWAISNICAGTKSQIQVIIDSTVIPKIIQMASNETPDIRSEAVFALLNTIAGGSREQIYHLYSNNVLHALCSSLTLNRLCVEILKALQSLVMGRHITGLDLKCAEHFVDYQHIQNLTNHVNPEIRHLATDIVNYTKTSII